MKKNFINCTSKTIVERYWQSGKLKKKSFKFKKAKATHGHLLHHQLEKKNTESNCKLGLVSPSISLIASCQTIRRNGSIDVDQRRQALGEPTIITFQFLLVINLIRTD